MNGTIIREALPADIPAIQPWLSQAFLGVPRARFFAAVDESGHVLGAVSLRILTSTSGQQEGRFLVFVRPECRRHGIGSALLRFCTDQARQTGAATVLAGRSLEANDPQTGFLERAGMEVCNRRIAYSAQISTILERLAPYWQRLQEERSIPTNARLTQLSDVSPVALTQFTTKYLGGIADAVLARIRNPNQGYCQQLSLVAMVGEQIAGVELVARIADTVTVDVIAVSPEFRGGWVNLWLKFHVAELMRDAGLPVVCFDADEQQHPDTIKYARRVGATVIGSRVLYGRTLNGHEG